MLTMVWLKRCFDLMVPKELMKQRLAKVAYLIAITVATAGWAWLLVQVAMALVGL